MKLPWLTLLFQLFTWVLSAKGAALNNMEEEEALDFLLQFGYLQQPLERFSHKFTEEEIEVALRAFQLASGLPTTGQVDMATLSQMRQPRCGVDDPFNERTLKYRLLGRWHKKHLTYRIYSYSKDLGIPATRTAIQTAFKYWSDVTQLTFQEVRTGRADIRLSFHGISPWICSRPFDGPGHVLAHADIPELGTVHFDSDEYWTEGTSRGINLRIIAAHEIGHALGLGHSRYPTALMAPSYNGYRSFFRLHRDDIEGIQALYGKKTLSTTAPETSPALSTAPAAALKPSKVPDPCKDDLDAIMLGPHDKTYAFHGDYVWMVTDFGTNPPLKISALWKGLPGWLDAAVYSPRTGRTYFFKGTKVWRYRGFKLDYGYPKPLTRIPAKIDAALYWPVNKKIFLFKDTEYWQWDELGSHFANTPRKISSLFTGAPSHLDAALTWENGKVYFFKGQSYWRLNDQLRVERGYPLSTAERWMNC
ncbi:LOW QUALITY PROTEIN: matrix metalloproteinase-19 [Pantherophis guttatus]|uniref:LOW QUALITY PROTEIN: matrix metalloproteinase-19 n=1 Tax=Pantherophis guttatus TaxID=94885 RepID=A0ABM3Z8W1_PANGU|nr:LOW QUALITY PROTEIN: matrix metalloproteinase-19 [Pantherophis guttatus]